MDLDQRIALVPVKYRSLYERAVSGRLPPRAAIKVKCYDCVGWERFDSGRDRIGDCPCRGCPLWHLRPFQKPPGNRSKASREASGEQTDLEIDSQLDSEP